MCFEPKQKNRVPEALTAALLVCAAVCVIFSSFEQIKGRGILQTLALIMFCAMIFFLVKYKLTRTRYTLRLRNDSFDGDSEGEAAPIDENGKERPLTAYPPRMLELTVEKAQGNGKFVTECVVALSDILTCQPYPSDDRAARKAMRREAGAGPTYKYVRNPVGADKWYITVRTAQGTAKLILEPGEKLGEYLSAVASYNKEQRKRERSED